MNELHLQLCASPEWAEAIERDILPRVLADVDLGDDVLEVGPGPGLTTEALRHRVRRLTAIEVDADLAASLARRMDGTNVEVLHGDATQLPFDDGRFSGAMLLTMLHHVPSAALQDRLFSEVARVLRPGGVMTGIDSVESDELRQLHDGDTYVPVDPGTLGGRLAQAGLTDISVETNEYGMRFCAAAPSEDAHR